MNIIGLLLGALTAVAVLASGCQQAAIVQMNKAKVAAGSKSELPEIEVSSTSLGGVWFGSCVRDVEKDELFRQDKIEIVLSYLSFYTEYFLDSNCENKLYEQTQTGVFNLSGEKILVSYSNLSVTPESSISAASFNQFDGFCKKKDWQVGNEESFSEFSVCGYSNETQFKIEQYGISNGANELFLNDRKFQFQKQLIK